MKKVKKRKLDQFDIDMCQALCYVGLQSSGRKGKDLALALVESIIGDLASDHVECAYWRCVEMFTQEYKIKPGSRTKFQEHLFEELGTADRAWGRLGGEEVEE